MEKKVELVFVPIPAMGHLPPAVELAKRILQQDHRISVVIILLNPLFDFPAVDEFVDSQSRDTRLTFIKLPPLSNPPDPALKNFAELHMDLQKPSLKQAVLDWGGPQKAPVGGFVLDLLCTTMIDVANDLHAPSYVFSTFGASLINLQFHLQSLADNHGVNVAEELSDPDRETDIPGFKNRVPGKAVPSMFLDKEVGSHLVLNTARRCRQVTGILVNTYEELESHSVQALLEQANDNKIPPVYPVGPILMPRDKRKEHYNYNYNSIMEWLDQQPPSSVVFLCFGSLGSLDEAQVKEVANGLERAGHRFLWSLRRPPPSTDKGIPSQHEKIGKIKEWAHKGIPSQHEAYLEALPEGFLERTAKIGKVIEWAPQVSILAHPAVGGFVSHCGWNSTLESMWCGVPMGTWPMIGDQQLNAFALVNEIGVAVPIIRMDLKGRQWQTNFLVAADEIESGVKKLMRTDEKIIPLRENVRDVRDKARKAYQQGGSSHRWIARFIADVFNRVALAS